MHPFAASWVEATFHIFLFECQYLPRELHIYSELLPCIFLEVMVDTESNKLYFNFRAFFFDVCKCLWSNLHPQMNSYLQYWWGCSFVCCFLKCSPSGKCFLSSLHILARFFLGDFQLLFCHDANAVLHSPRDRSPQEYLVCCVLVLLLLLSVFTLYFFFVSRCICGRVRNDNCCFGSSLECC